MGWGHMRVVGWIGLILIGAGCGSKQSQGTTAVSSGGADLRDEPPVTEVASDEEVDPEIWDPEPPVEAEESSNKKTPRRDIKMMSYEEAMALPVELGDPTAGGGEGQLTADEIARFMDDHLDEMYDECIKKELQRGNELGTVTIDLVIRGKDGMVVGTTIEPGRRRFQNCLEGYLEDVRFPPFASARMGASYRFLTD
ncbi:MAG: hypothetical protein WCB63_00925 [Polyangiales bacterium]